METLTRYSEEDEYFYVRVRNINEDDMRKMVGVYIAQARKKSHGRIRVEQRMKISERVQRREESRQVGKLRPVLASMLGPYRKGREGYTMETLRINDHIKADPIQIHQVLTENFRKWFAEPTEGRQREWQTFSTDDEFIERNKFLNIPDQVLKTIWSSLQNKAEIDESLANTPTYEEFSKAIDHMAKDSAPGMSGLSYNMMRVWGDEIRKRIYEDICELWERGEFPAQWKQRWIVPIPKKSDPDIGDLRPLMLMEALRKVWGSIFVRRIQKKWKDTKILQPNQFGGIPGKGTDGAVFEFLNVAETARERKTPIYVTSWDIRRAFDSVSKPLITLALRRLGIPKRLTDYIAKVDEGLSVVRTPWALSCWEEEGVTEGFIGERGIGQGDVTSPLIWTAFFDILLTALEEVEGGIATCSRHGHLRETPDIAYVDDLISVQGDLSSLQMKADIVSGFCLWAGLTLAADKFRAYAVNWGNEHIEMGTHITVHIENWTPMEVKMRADGNLKHLGVLWDMDLGNETQRLQMERYLKEALAYIMSRRASARCKLIAITKCVIPKIIYVCKFMGWTIDQYEKLERLISTALRTTMKHLPGFPNDLLYIPRDEGGMGFTSLVDIVQRTKYRMQQRLYDDDESFHAADSLMSRAFRARGQILQPNTEVMLKQTEWLSAVWATSLVQWMEREGYQLTATGTKEEEEAIDGEVEHGLATGLYTINERRGGPVRLRVGQFWAHAQHWDETNAVEITAVNEGRVHGLVWTCNEGCNITKGVTMTATPATHGDGGGPGVLAGHPQDMVAAFGDTATLLSVTADSHCKRNGKPVNECIILDTHHRTMVPPRQSILPEQAQFGKDVEIYTDGTYQCFGTLEEWSQGTQQERAAAGVVIVAEQQEIGYRITGVAMNNAYEAETVGIAVAGFLAPGAVIHTDCKAAQDATGTLQHRIGISHLRRIAPSRLEVKKVQAHAERRKHRRDWSREEEGNCKADAVASGRIQEAGLSEGTVDLERAISIAFPLVWKDSSGRIAFDNKGTRRSQRYTVARDEWRRRAADPRPSRWVGTTNKLGAAMWSKQECSWAQAVRIMWDKNSTGENQCKWKCKEVSKCSVCGVPTSQRHMILECQRPGAAAVRARALAKVRREADKNGSTLVGKSLRAVLSLCEHEEAHTLWTGLWSPAVRAAMAARCPWTLTRREYSRMVAALRHLAEGVLDLYKQGMSRGVKRTRDGVVRRELRQANMEEFFGAGREDMGLQNSGMEDPHEINNEGTAARGIDEREHDNRKYDR
jgi:hypothetical protein